MASLNLSPHVLVTPLGLFISPFQGHDENIIEIRDPSYYGTHLPFW